MAPADAREATSGAGDSTRRPCDIALQKLLELQRTSGASDCGGLVKHAGRDRCWLHTELWVTHIGRGIQGLQKGSLATCRSLPHASSKCAEHRRCTHRVDQRSVASDWWWGGLQQVPARGLGLGLQLQGLQETLRTAHHCVAGVSGSAGQLGRHWGRRRCLQEVAPADASEATSGAGDSTRRPCDIALKKLLELQRTSGASDCAGRCVR